MMKKKAKVIATAAAVAIIISMLITPQQDPLNPPNVPDIRPVCDYAIAYRDNAPPTKNKTLVGEEIVSVK